MTQSSEYYLYGQDRVALPREHLRILGFPDTLALKGLTSSQLKSLAGDSMAMPCVTLVLLCMVHALRKDRG